MPFHRHILFPYSSCCSALASCAFLSPLHSDSPYSEHGTLEEVDQDAGTEPHTSEDGMLLCSCYYKTCLYIHCFRIAYLKNSVDTIEYEICVKCEEQNHNEQLWHHCLPYPLLTTICLCFSMVYCFTFYFLKLSINVYIFHGLCLLFIMSLKFSHTVAYSYTHFSTA